jgi:hypothetical protein
MTVLEEPMHRGIVVAVAWLAGVTPLAAGVQGSFVNKGVKYPVVDGVAYERKAEMGEETAVRLALSTRPLDAGAIAAALDVEDAVTAQRGDGAYVDLEFALDGRYAGASYSLGSGNGCGWCSDSKAAAKSQVKVENGHLKGTMKVLRADYSEKDGPAITLTIDLPIVKVSATALPANGGEPGKALLACRRLAKAKDAAGAKERCFAPDDALAGRAWQAEPDTFWSMALMYGRDSLRLPTLQIRGGRTKGDWAEVQVEGKDSDGTTQKGGVFFHMGPNGWRYHHEKLQPEY